MSRRDGSGRQTRPTALFGLFGLFGLFALLTALPGQGAETLLSVTPTGNSALQRLPLPAEIYARCAFSDLRDLRLSNPRGDPVPFAYLPPQRPVLRLHRETLLPYALESQPATWTVSRNTAQAAGDAQALVVYYKRYLFTRGQTGGDAVRLLLDWPTGQGPANFSVQVEASSDLQHWQTLAEQYELYDLHNGENREQQRAIPLPASQAKYLRVTVHHPDGPTLSRATVESYVPPPKGETPTADDPALWLSPAPPRMLGDGRYVFNAGRVPFDALRVTLTQPNTLLPITLYSRPTAQSSWRWRAQGTVFRMNLADGEHRAELISIPQPVNDGEWMLEIDPNTARPAEGTLQLALHWSSRLILFLAPAPGEYQLRCGDPKLNRADLPVAQLAPGLDAPSLYALPLAAAHYSGANGEMVPDSRTVAQPTALGNQGPQWAQWGLWGLLLLGVGTLGAMARYLLKEMKNGPKRDQPPGKD